MNCPICNSKHIRRRRYDRYKRENSFMVCKVCGHGFCALHASPEQLEDVNREVFSGVQESAGDREHDSAFKVDSYSRWLINKAVAYTAGESGLSFIEIGCNTGRILKGFVKESGFKCYGNDIVAETCKYVTQTFGVPTYEGAFSAQLVAPERFDVMLVSHVMEHISDPQAFVQELYSAGKPGSLVMVVVPNDGSLMAGFKRKVLYRCGVIGEYGYMHYPMHLQGYSKASLTHLFERCGFATVESGTLTKCQREYDEFFRHKWDALFMPLYLMEYLTGRGNILFGIFRRS